ncbi:unnamed protein product [Ambrosiozyma monospora]|uniref:Unnamed protein product n=1 Tax=Ambrosiozyma monospora TaxID=43982 RepID=A0A9W6YX74_AMBMO|nr:unnamed protein product [Ambrosiozyma monospora]
MASPITDNNSTTRSNRQQLEEATSHQSTELHTDPIDTTATRRSHFPPASISTESLKMKFQNDSALQKDFEVNNKQLLKQRRSNFSKTLVSHLEKIGGMLLVILFITDESFLLLLLRAFLQFMISNDPTKIPGASQIMTDSGRRVVALKMLEMMCWMTAAAMILHTIWLSGYGLMDLSAASEGRNSMEVFLNGKINYSYGAFAINFIGEGLYQNWFRKWIFSITADIVLFAVHFLLYSVNYLIKSKLLEDVPNKKTNDSNTSSDSNNRFNHQLTGELSEGEEEMEMVKEYDGYQGNILLYEIDPVEIFKMVFKFERTVISTPEEETRNQNQNDANNDGNGSANIMPGSYIRRFANIDNLV